MADLGNDPRDLSEIRLFHRDDFLCRVVSEEHAGKVVTLKAIEAARRAHRRALRMTWARRRRASWISLRCRWRRCRALAVVGGG